MIFDPSLWCCPRGSLESEFSQPLDLESPGLWVGMVHSGECVVNGPADDAAAGPGSLVLGQGPLRLVPAQSCRFLAVELTGSAAEQFCACLPGPMAADGASCPGAGELLARLLAAPEAPLPLRCGLAAQLLCLVSAADAAAPALPPLVAQAVVQIRENYAGLYGVEELSESLGVSKSHLVRSFSQAMGLPPGQYLTQVRIEAAKQLLVHREYPLEIVASLCGFSGSNYLCRVFKKATGLTPAAWRAQNGAADSVGPLPLERELYV